MINVMELLGILFYLALLVLIVLLIVLVVKALGTLNKIDKVVDDISVKSSKLDGLFNFIDSTTDTIVGISDRFVSFIANGVENLFTRKRGKKDE